MGTDYRGHLYHVPSHKLLRSRTAPHSFNMGDRDSKLYSVGGAFEAIFTDQDSGSDNFDCGSYVEYCPESEDVSANEENGMEDNSFVLPPSNLSQDVETVSNDQEGNSFATRIMKTILLSVFSKSKIYLTCLYYMYT